MATVDGTVIDAKGDLFVGSGADAYDNLAAGSDGTGLLADSNEALGVNYKLPQLAITPVVGNYFSAHHTTRTTGTATSLRMYFTPLWLPCRMTLDRIGIEVTTLDAACSCHLGIYAHDHSTQRPGLLLVDAGSVNLGSTGVVEATINATVGPGLVWLASRHAGGSTRVVRFSASSPVLVSLPTSGILGASALSHYVDTTNPDFNSPATPNTGVSSAPLVIVRRSA